jgi:hypothetical protein
VIGVGHLEGWGLGRDHLLRPDELVVRESNRRGMGLASYVRRMQDYGKGNGKVEEKKSEGGKVGVENMSVSEDHVMI